MAPRDGSGTYSKPPGTTAIPNTTIASAPYNALQDDMADALTESLPRTGVAPMLADLSMNGNKITGLADGADAGDAVNFGQLGTKLNADASNVGDTAAQAAFRSAISAPLRGHIFGLTLSNNTTDATNDIDIAAGEAASTETNPSLMSLASGLTKRLDEAWAVGTDNGGLDTGAIADGTYHVWLIRRSDTGVVDALFSTSATSPTMPTNYDQKRRIGSIVRVSGAIKTFSQMGDQFLWKSPPLDVNVSNPGTSATLRTMTVPSGIPVIMQANFVLHNDGTGAYPILYASSPDTNDLAPSLIDGLAQIPNIGGSSPYPPDGISTIHLRTNSSAQIRTRLSASDASVILRVVTLGWIDTRGKDA